MNNLLWLLCDTCLAAKDILSIQIKSFNALQSSLQLKSLDFLITDMILLVCLCMSVLWCLCLSKCIIWTCSSIYICLMYGFVFWIWHVCTCIDLPGVIWCFCVLILFLNCVYRITACCVFLMHEFGMCVLCVYVSSEMCVWCV